MEIIQGGERLGQEILARAQAEAAATLASARAAADAIVAEARAAAVTAAEAFTAQQTRAVDERVRLLGASVEVELRRRVDERVGALIDGFFDALRADLLAGGRGPYPAFLARLARRSAALLGAGPFLVRLSPAEAARVPAAALTGAGGGTFTGAAVDPELTDGLVLRAPAGRQAAYVSLDRFLGEIREATRGRLRRLVTGKE